MRSSILERSALLRIAPHLVEPLPFLVPTYGHGARGKTAMRIASRINDIVSLDRNRHLHELGCAIPGGSVVSREACLEKVPALPDENLTGGIVFYDAQMWNADRMTLGFALSACARGAVAVNYARAIRLLTEGSSVAGAAVRDELTGDIAEVRARVTLNVTGPWANRIVEPLAGKRRTEFDRFPLSKGFQIIVPSITRDIGLALTSYYRDPDAVMRRGGRHYFVTPWRGHSIVGTTDTAYRGEPGELKFSEEEIASFVDEVRHALPATALRFEDVVHAYGGLQPADPRRIGTGAQVSKRPLLIDHERDLKWKGLVSCVGVKYTACRWLAEQAVNLVCAKLGYRKAACTTARMPLLGGDIKHLESFEEKVRRAAPVSLDEQVVRHMKRTYGTQVFNLWNMMNKVPALSQCIAGSGEVTAAEVIHAVRNEAAVTLADVVLRRTDLGTLGHPHPETLQDVAARMGSELGWDADRMASEIAEVRALYPVGYSD
jgi:glycerol-3-phosphate dehydrogenase